MRDAANTLVWPVSTFVLALILSVIPMPDLAVAIRPPWPALVMIYWTLVAPERFGLMTAMVLGLAVDTLSGALLGQNAFAMLIITYFGLKFHLRLRFSPISQTTMTVFGMLLIYEFILFWVDGVAGRTVPFSERWMPLLIGTLLWPLILELFDRIQRHDQARIES
jgi:rod shape-determining protein MreD